MWGQKSQIDDRETSQFSVRNCGESSNEKFRCENQNQPIKTNTAEKKIEAETYYFSATAGEKANKLPIQTFENTLKGKTKMDRFRH